MDGLTTPTLSELVEGFCEEDLLRMRAFSEDEYVPLIKWVRERWPLSLVRARDFIDILIISKNLPQFANRRASVMGAWKTFHMDITAGAVYFSKDEWDKVARTYKHQGKVDCIKLVRIMRTIGLKDAKDLVDEAIRKGIL